MKKFLLIVFSFFLFMSNVNALEVNSNYLVLYNLDEDEIMFEKNMNEVTSIASLTKIMTTLVAIENIKDYDEKIILRASMFEGLKEANAYVIGLRELQQVTYNDLLYGMFLASGADATRAIAISIAGSEEVFVDLMNKKAASLGLKNTHFKNTIGLDDAEHYSTVNEVAFILKEALKNNKFREIFLTSNYVFSDKSIKVQSSMRRAFGSFEIENSDILGGKTGYTGAAGRCLASIAKDKVNNTNYLLVTTGANSVKEPVLDARKIYDYYFENYGYQELIDKGDLLIELSTKYSNSRNVKFYAKETILKYLANDYKRADIKLKYNGLNVITPNLKQDDKLGDIEVFYKNEKLKNIEIRLERKISFSILGFLIFYKWLITGGLLVFLVVFTVLFKKIKKS